MSSNHCSQSNFYQRFTRHDHERRMNKVVVLTCVMMVAEIFGGWWLGSMALLADGWHMATHSVALGISAFAYGYARRHAHDSRYSFGTGKVSDLAGYTSAIILMFVTFYILYESVVRLVAPVSIAYHEAIAIAAVGLGVNILSAMILHGSSDQDHSHDQDDHQHDHAHAHNDHAHHHHGHDNNFRSAYVHVIADAVTSVAALAALFCGMSFGWGWMDPAMGIVGAGVILSWAWGLVRDTSAMLLDRDSGGGLADRIRHILAEQNVRVVDMHVWRVGHNCHAAVLAVAPPPNIVAEDVRNWLHPLDIAHLTVEISG